MTTTNKPTIAEQIADLFDNDGSRKINRITGEFIQDVCAEKCVARDNDNNMYKYIFADKSVITICGTAWDIGYPDCMCWQSTRHNDDCPNR